MLPLGEKSAQEKLDEKIRSQIFWMIPLVAAAAVGTLGKFGYFQERWLTQLSNDMVFIFLLVFGAVGLLVESIRLGALYYQRSKLREQQNT